MLMGKPKDSGTGTSASGNVHGFFPLYLPLHRCSIHIFHAPNSDAI